LKYKMVFDVIFMDINKRKRREAKEVRMETEEGAGYAIQEARDLLKDRFLKEHPYVFGVCIKEIKLIKDGKELKAV